MTDLTFALSEDTVVDVFGLLRDEFEFSASDSVDNGRLSAGYDVGAELRRGSIDLRAPNEVRVEELDIFWRTLRASFGVDLRRRCVGGGCVIGNPFGSGCAVRAPRVCLFEDDPDIQFTLDLSNALNSEVTFTAKVLVQYLQDRPAGVSYLRAQELEAARTDSDDPHKINRWGVFIDPDEVDIDIIDVADSVGDFLERQLDAAINGIFSDFPDWVRDAIEAIVGSVIDLVRTILDIPDDIQEWLSDMLGETLGLFNVIAEAIADYLLREPIFDIEDPYPVLEETSSPSLIPVKIPIEELDASVSDTELVVTGSIGGSP